jgi:hypothetical protein
MTTHAMIDLETLGTKPNCVILTLGAIKFNPLTADEPNNGIYQKFDIDQQDKLGRSQDESTIEWWGKQAKNIQDEAFGEDGRISLEQCTKELNKFLVGVDVVWAQGPVFDIVILENLYQQLGLPLPWNFWQIRDSRTLFSLLPEDPRKAIRQEAHNALADCYFQAKCVQKAYSDLKVVK